jgi:hypothetical protein
MGRGEEMNICPETRLVASSHEVEILDVGYRTYISAVKSGK